MGFCFRPRRKAKQPPTGVFASELAMARTVRDGKIKMPLLPVLYELPDRLTKDDGWKNRKYWPLVNPNLAVDQRGLSGARGLMRAEADGPAAVALIAIAAFQRPDRDVVPCRRLGRREITGTAVSRSGLTLRRRARALRGGGDRD